MHSAYEVYCQWCKDHGHKPPTPAEFYHESNQLLPWARLALLPRAGTDAVQAEIDRERREGWAYD